MYHDVFPRAGERSDYFAVPADRFSEQLSEIKALGYAGLSLEDALRATSDRVVAITFDDATSSQVEEAFPRLVEHGMTATFFAVSDWVGRPGYATWDQLRELKAHGMQVQSHTHSHPFLSELTPAQVAAEIGTSKQMLDQQLGQSTETLALPGGDFPRRRAKSAIAAAGYQTVATSVFGMNSRINGRGETPRLVRRCTMRGDADIETFRKILAGDARLFWKWRVRETVLRNLRRGLGPTRYARWRRRVIR